MNKNNILFFIVFFTSSFFAKDYHDLLNQKKETSTNLVRINNDDLKITIPDFIFENTNTKIELQFLDNKNNKLLLNNYQLAFVINGNDVAVKFNDLGYAIVNHKFQTNETINILIEDFSFRKEPNIIALWMILLPIAFVLLLITLRILNIRAKNKIAKKNQASIALAQKTLSPKKTKTPVLEKEEELVH